MQHLLKIQTDPQIQKLLLDLLISAVEAGDVQRLIDAGLPAALLDDLRQLRGFEVARLIYRDLGFSLGVDGNALAHQIQVLKLQLDDQRTREQFILAGCPTALAFRLFRMSKRDLVALRLSLGVGSDIVGSGHVRLTQRCDIEEAWLATRPDRFQWLAAGSTEALQAEIAAWKALMKACPGFSLHALYAVVMHFERFGSASDHEAKKESA
jgi:hypothetical protein